MQYRETIKDWIKLREYDTLFLDKSCMKKYLLLPAHLLRFWYIEGAVFFLRTWKNLMLLLEEDLAVGLMWRLLWVPLFHDSSWVGRILSFLFRITRIFMGLFAFCFSSVVLLLTALYWFLLPVLAYYEVTNLLYLNYYFLSRSIFLTGLGLFIIHSFAHPHKKVWETKDPWSCSAVSKAKVNLSALVKNWEVLNLLQNLEFQPSFLPNLKVIDIDSVATGAFKMARDSGSLYIGARHFFAAILENTSNIDNVLLPYGLKLADFKDCLNYLEKKKQIWRRVYLWDEDFTTHHLKGVNRGWLGVPTPALDLVGEDLTKVAATSTEAKFVRSSSAVQDIVNILSQSSGRNVILVGPPGSGKSALIKHLAKMIVKGDAPDALATKRLVMLDLAKLLSGIKTQGELAERVKNIFDEVSFAQNIIIVIDEIHELGLGEAGGSFNLYSLLEPFLEADTFQLIGITEEQNYSKVLEKNAAFARIFRKIEMPPASEGETLEILEYRSIMAERENKIKTTFAALKTAVELSKKFIKDRVLPDSAIAVLKEAQTIPLEGWVTKDTIKKVVSSRVKVPVMEIGTADKTKLLNLEEEIHSRMIDQEQAVKAVSDSLRRSATGLREGNRPIGSFLFVGPTGVGKTELAKTLAEVYFKTEGSFLRFDMSEYQNPESVVRLIGAEGEGGLLTEDVRQKPYALVLLDEFEKANDKILTLFLQVLDDGRLTDGAGRTIGFENTIIIATSNVGSLLIAQELQAGNSMEQIDKQVNDMLLKVFKPELINRFDDIVIFKPLSQEDLAKIVTLKLSLLKKQMKEKGYLLEFSPELVAQLGQKGFDPVMGARSLRRLIQDTLEANLSKLILENKLIKGKPYIIESSG